MLVMLHRAEHQWLLVPAVHQALGWVSCWCSPCVRPSHQHLHAGVTSGHPSNWPLALKHSWCGNQPLMSCLLWFYISLLTV